MKGPNGETEFQGTISGLRYDLQGDSTVSIRGSWSLNGTSGYLNFPVSVERPSQFNGVYWLDPPQSQRGPWNGRRFYVFDRKNPPVQPGFRDKGPPADEDFGNPGSPAS